MAAIITPWACNEPLVPNQLFPNWFDGTVMFDNDTTSISVWNVPTSQYYSLNENVLDYYLVFNESLPTTPALSAANFSLLVTDSETVSPICGIPYPPYTFHSRILPDKDDGSFHVGPIPCVLEFKKIPGTMAADNIDPKTNDGGTAQWFTVLLVWIIINTLVVTV
jgi:hypothetical protein